MRGRGKYITKQWEGDQASVRSPSGSLIKTFPRVERRERKNVDTSYVGATGVLK